MMTDDPVTLITESTFDSFLRRYMERLEERIHRGEREVTIDIRELLHLLSRLVGTERDRQHLQEMLYRTFKGYSDHFNMTVNRVPMVVKKKDPCSDCIDGVCQMNCGPAVPPSH